MEENDSCETSIKCFKNMSKQKITILYFALRRTKIRNGQKLD
jgi:hypothetical protein